MESARRRGSCVAVAFAFGLAACADEGAPTLSRRDAIDVDWGAYDDTASDGADVHADARDDEPGPDAAPPYGLPPRLLNTRCKLDGDAAIGDPYEAARLFPALTFDEPADVLLAPGDTTRAYVQGRRGVIEVVDVATGARHDTPFLDLRDRVLCCAEQGLLGVAFDPDLERRPYVYIYHSLDAPRRTRLSRFTLVDRDQADRSSELVLLEIAQPTENHHGGMLAFGPDGYLYVTVGDGSGDLDRTYGFGQRVDDLNANILRIDVAASAPGHPYDVPPDNPLIGHPGARPEIWAYGFRNPWRIAFDGDDLWIGDVQEASYEEINLGVAGGNFGWHRMEASHCLLPPSDCDDGTLVRPLFEYPHGNGLCAIIGGFVYRGTRLPELAGSYLYGDHCTGYLWALRAEAGQVLENRRVASTGLNLTSIAPGPDGEVWLSALTGGLYRLRAVEASTGPSTFPTTLSATGCFSDLATRTPADGVLPYDLNTPLWSDGAHKRRWLVLPGVATIGLSATGSWAMPPGTILIKEFDLETEAGDPNTARPIETRFLSLGPDGGKGYSYRWNEAGTDAELLADGVTVDVPISARGDTLPWYFPSRSDCGGCHNAAAGGSLGLTTAQLNRRHDYGAVVDDQLRAMEHIGLFGGPLPERPEALPRQLAPDDEAAPLEARVRSYLAANCAHCHRPGGPSAAALDLRLETPLAATGTVDVAPTRGDLGVGGAAIVAPGDPERSILYLRMARRGPNQMPPLATSAVDEVALDVVRRWILSLGAP